MTVNAKEVDDLLKLASDETISRRAHKGLVREYYKPETETYQTLVAEKRTLEILRRAVPELIAALRESQADGVELREELAMWVDRRGPELSKQVAAQEGTIKFLKGRVAELSEENAGWTAGYRKLTEDSSQDIESLKAQVAEMQQRIQCL